MRSKVKDGSYKLPLILLSSYKLERSWGSVGWGAGIDSGSNVLKAGVGAFGGATLSSSSMVGVTYTNLRGPIFRSVNTGRFVSNTYGGVRTGITSGAQLGLIYGLNFSFEE